MRDELPMSENLNAESDELQVKRKQILCVGRFTYNGHCKNQHLLAQSFVRLKDSCSLSDGWEIVVAGSVDFASSSSADHFSHTKEILYGYPATVIPNASRDTLVSLYRQSSLFVHAAGLGVDILRTPEKCEHFGIAVFEAILSGCIPVVFSEGGPPDQVESLPLSYLFEDCASLDESIANAARYLDSLTTEESARIFRQTSRSAVELVACARQKAIDLFSFQFSHRA